METNTTDPTQKTENLDKFFKDRITRNKELNQEIQNLVSKLKKETNLNKEILLFSITLEEVIVFLGKQLRDNYYKGLDYPETGLFLRQIDFIYKEYVSNTALEYCNNIVIVFNFDKTDFNGHMSLSSLGFNDEKLRITEQIVGLGFDPCFADKEKYLLVQKLLRETRSKITVAGGN